VRSESEYMRDTLQRINSKYSHEIVYVQYPFQIVEYIAAHPEKEKIGFLVDEPIYVHYLPRGSGHISPFYFERRGGTEYLMQFDSIALPYPLSESSDPKITRKQYYSPFLRQTNKQGCFEDAVKILIKCFQEKDLVAFCESNSEKYNVIKNKPDEADFLQNRQRKVYELAVAILGSPCVSEFYKLTSLPARFLVNIEHYETMRHFQTTEPEKFNVMYNDRETVREHIRRKGSIRSITEPDIATNSLKKDDIKGQNFYHRRLRYKKKESSSKRSRKEITAILAANLFLSQFRRRSEPQAWDSFWDGKLDAPMEDIIRHALGENKRDPLGIFGHPGNKTKEKLMQYGINFDKKFKELSMEEKVAECANKILKIIYSNQEAELMAAEFFREFERTFNTMEWDSFWDTRSLAGHTTMEEIILRALDEGKRGPFGLGESLINNTRKMLMRFGVEFNQDFKKLSMNEKIDICTSKIKNSPIRNSTKQPKPF